MLRVPFETMCDEFERVLLALGFTQERGKKCARIFAENSRDGVYSHGLNRFPSFVDKIKKGIIRIHAEPERVKRCGVMEQWDGRLGPGPLVAWRCMERAVEIARENVMGCVALRNNNHWMRAGTYGLAAVALDCIGICFTNTIPNMPPWGAARARTGNNPLAIAFPHENGPVLLDIALAQFSFGKLEIYARAGETLPFEGGFDGQGRLTADPKAILESRRPLPIGLWKGSGLALMLDLLAALLSGGKATHELGQDGEEYEVSQVFIAFDLSQVTDKAERERRIEAILSHYVSAPPLSPSRPVHYPGQGMLRLREENLREGIPVDEKYWQRVCELEQR